MLLDVFGFRSLSNQFNSYGSNVLHWVMEWYICSVFSLSERAIQVGWCTVVVRIKLTVLLTRKKNVLRVLRPLDRARIPGAARSCGNRGRAARGTGGHGAWRCTGFFASYVTHSTHFHPLPSLLVRELFFFKFCSVKKNLTNLSHHHSHRNVGQRMRSPSRGATAAPSRRATDR